MHAGEQVQKHGAVHGGQKWYMPAVSYYVTPLPGINLEIVALDTNFIDYWPTCPWVACGRVECADGNARYACPAFSLTFSRSCRT